MIKVLLQAERDLYRMHESLRVARPSRLPSAINALALLICMVMLAPAARSAEDYFPFVIPWDDAAATPFSMTERFADGPAGKHGLLRAQGDHLVFEDGTPARLWGIGMSATAQFPPADKLTADALIRKLTKYGFNVVRIRAIDAGDVGLYEPWLKTGKLDPKIMDRIDYFVAQLEKAGIYYSLGINVTSPRHAARGSVDAAEYARAPKRYNGVQIFDETAIDDTLHWYAAIMTHVNTYTKVSYANDPGFAYVPGVAEDSIFHQYFSERDSLGANNEAALNKVFNKYLASHYANREELRKAWQEEGRRGLSDGEDFSQGTVAIVPWKDASTVSRARARDTVRFFYTVNLEYAQRIRDGLRSAGYRGLYTGTNNWFGPGNQLMNHEVGDYAETQAYFDLPAMDDSGRGSHEVIRNISFFAGDANNRAKSIFAPNLYRLFVTAPTDRPLIISEWNHSAWSDYAYEGPLLLTAYASFQGYRGMLIHTYLAREDVHAEYGKRALFWVGNAVLIALTPTLSLAFRRGDIAEGTDTVIVPTAGDEAAMMDLGVINGESAQLGSGQIPLDTGFIHKLRVQLPGAKGSTGAAPAKDSPGSDLKSSTGEILWHRDPAQGLFVVNAPRFQAAAGHLEAKDVELKNAIVRLAEHGAVTAIALDDREISTSQSVLVTAVSSFKNTNALIEEKTARNGKVTGKTVKDAGSGPMLLERVHGTFTFRTALKEQPHVYSLTTAGAVTEIALQNGGASGELHSYRFELGTKDSPWYWIKF